MTKSHFNDAFLVLLGPIISRFFACSNEEKNKPKQQRVLALVLSIWLMYLAREQNYNLFSPTLSPTKKKGVKYWQNLKPFPAVSYDFLL